MTHTTDQRDKYKRDNENFQAGNKDFTDKGEKTRRQHVIKHVPNVVIEVWHCQEVERDGAEYDGKGHCQKNSGCQRHSVASLLF